MTKPESEEAAVIDVGSTLYRAEVRRDGTIHYDDASVTKMTPCGFWASNYGRTSRLLRHYDDTWYPFDTRKWSVTKEEALKRLRTRKFYHVRHATRRHADAVRQLRAVQTALGVGEAEARDEVERAERPKPTFYFHPDPW